MCRVALDRGGYVPGETIGISASVHNKSRVTIKGTKASLTEVTTMQQVMWVSCQQYDNKDVCCGSMGSDLIGGYKHSSETSVPTYQFTTGVIAQKTTIY